MQIIYFLAGSFQRKNLHHRVSCRMRRWLCMFSAVYMWNLLLEMAMYIEAIPCSRGVTFNEMHSSLFNDVTEE